MYPLVIFLYNALSTSEYIVWKIGQCLEIQIYQILFIIVIIHCILLRTNSYVILYSLHEL